MAFLPESEVEKQQEQQAPGATQENVVGSQGGTIGGTGGGPVGQGGAASMQSPGQSAGGRAGGARFTNLQAYLGANQEQAGQMGQEVAGSVANKAQQAQQKTEQAKQSFDKALGASGQGYDAGLVSSINQGQIDTQKAQKALNTQYQGPRALSDVAEYNDAAGAQEQAQSALNMTGSEGGRAALLQEKYARPSYSAGQQRLDQFLLGGSAQGKQALEGVRSQYADIGKQFNQVGERAAAAGQQREQDTNRLRQDVLSGLQQQNMGLKSGLEQRVAQTNQQRQGEQAALQDFLKNRKDIELGGQATAQQIQGKALYDKLNQQAGGQFSEKALTQGADVGMSDVATEQEKQKFAQLRQLLGGDLDYSVTSPTGAPQADALGVDQNALAAQAKARSDKAQQSQRAANLRESEASRSAATEAQQKAKADKEASASVAAKKQQAADYLKLEESRLKRGAGTYSGDKQLENFYKSNPDLAKAKAANEKEAKKYSYVR